MRIKIIRILVLLILPCLVLSISGCKDREVEPNYIIRKYAYYGYLNTNSSITVQFDQNKISVEEMQTKMSKVDHILVDIEKDFSMKKTIFMDEPSLLMKVNANSGALDENNNLVYTKVNQRFMNMLKTSIEVSKLLDGSFDVTIGPLTRLWNISGQVGYDPMFVKIPTEDEINEKLQLVDYSYILIDEENMQVCLPIAGMEVDFGAIAKGYAADCVLEYIKTLPIEVAMIDLGGNIYTYGSSPTTSQTIGIRNPYYEQDKSQPYQLMSADIRDISIVTSGTYERYVVKDEKIYHHLLDPKTGYPFDNEMYCVTIIGPSSMFCDAIATGIYGLGLEAGINKINEIEGYSAIFITTDKRVYLTKGLNFVPTEGTDDFTFIYS